MALSVRMAAYRALSRRDDKKRSGTGSERPDATLIWVHAAETGNSLAIADLVKQMIRHEPGLSVLVTLPNEDQTELNSLPQERAVFVDVVPSEHPDAVTQFLDHWKPDLCLWLWGDLRPNLVFETAQRRCPMLLCDVDTRGLDTAHNRWLPELTGQLLSLFTHCVARSPSALRRLRSLGVPAQKTELSGALQAGGDPLPCNDDDLSDFRADIAGRPVWFAAGVQAAEIAPVVAAHREVARLSHRLLLLVSPASADLVPTLRCHAEGAGLIVADWGAAEFPDETTQVLLSDDPGDLGLFFRIAPVCFLGSSLVPGFGGQNPFVAASLGSAVLYGPNIRNFLSSYTRLANAGAARMVKDAETLATTVSRLIAPEQAAGMACAGWDVISEGAEAADHLIDLVDRHLPVREGRSDACA